MAKHTPTPWRTNKDATAVISEEGRICEVILQKAPTHNRPQEFHDGRQKANAAFIVRSCNNFDRLVAALEAAIKALQDGTAEHAAAVLIGEGRAALAAAKE